MSYAIILSHRPSSKFGDDTPEALPSGTMFNGFRASTGRRAASIGGVAEVVIFDEYRHASLKTWATKEAAERNVHHLISRGWTARVTVW